MEAVSTYHSILQQGYIAPFQIPPQLRSLLHGETDEIEQFAIQTEIKCFEFSTRNGNLVPQIERIDAKGNRFAYPDLTSFSSDEWNYIENRLGEKIHPFLLARYAHLLWAAKKHNRYAQAAIVAYKEVAALCFEESQRGERLFHNFIEALMSYHLLSATVKYEVNDCKIELLSWLKRDELPYVWKPRLLNLVAESPVFKVKDYQGLSSLMLSYLKKEQYGYTEGKYYLEALLPLAQKEKVSDREILDLLGENELALALKRQDDETGMIPFMCYQRAAAYFKSAGQTDKFESAAQLYAAQKHKIKLGKISIELSDDKVQKFDQMLNNLVDHLLSGEPFDPFLFLVTDQRMLLPKEISAEEIKQQRQNSIMDLFTLEVFDQNNNGKTLSEDEKVRHHQFQHYTFSLQLTALPLMEKLFYKGFKTGSISRHTFMSYFNQTWLALPLDGYTVDGEPSPYSWMELLGPGLNELVKEMDAEIQDKDYKASYILPIDSLSIKLEGAIRDFALVAGMPVSKIKESEALEMLLEDVLNHPSVLEVFDKGDVLLWKTVLTKRGWNVRNNNAHGFYRPWDYSRQKALLLLLCVYRLSGYVIKSSNQ